MYTSKDDARQAGRSCSRGGSINEDGILSHWGIRHKLREEEELEPGPERFEEKGIPNREKQRMRVQR